MLSKAPLAATGEGGKGQGGELEGLTVAHRVYKTLTSWSHPQSSSGTGR